MSRIKVILPPENPPTYISISTPTGPETKPEVEHYVKVGAIWYLSGTEGLYSSSFYIKGQPVGFREARLLEAILSEYGESSPEVRAGKG